MKKISLFIAISLLLFSACGNKTSKQEQNTEATSEFSDIPIVDEADDYLGYDYRHDDYFTKINIAEDIFYVTIDDENYPEECCLIIRDKQFDTILQKCYDYTFIEIREQKNTKVLSLTFISGKHCMSTDFEYINNEWIAENVVYFAMGKKSQDKKISVNLKDFDFGYIQEKWCE